MASQTATDEPTYVAHCPDCTYATARPRSSARAHQKRHACPNCARGVAVKPLSSASDALKRRARSDEGPTVNAARIGGD